MMATRSAPGRSSASWKSRPITGVTDGIDIASEVIQHPSKRSAVSVPLTLKVPHVEAPNFEKAFCCARQSTKS
jgi:hypothetical protein